MMSVFWACLNDYLINLKVERICSNSFSEIEVVGSMSNSNNITPLLNTANLYFPNGISVSGTPDCKGVPSSNRKIDHAKSLIKRLSSENLSYDLYFPRIFSTESVNILKKTP